MLLFNYPIKKYPKRGKSHKKTKQIIRIRLQIRSINALENKRKGEGGDRSERKETMGRVQLSGSLNAQMNSLEVN